MEPDMISGGFYITRVVARPSYLGNSLLPERIVTLSSCLASLFPDYWALEWASCSDEERFAALEKLGLRKESLTSVTRLASEALNRGDVGWSCVWQSASAARAAVSELSSVPGDLMILELGIPGDDAATLISELAPPPGIGESGLLTRLKTWSTTESGAVPLGWEVLGVECGGAFHSWLCNSLQEAAYKELSIEPGPLGLLSSKDDARAVVKLIDEGLGAEPVPWFSALLARVA